MEFVHHLQPAPQNARHLQHVHFVNIDKETTEAMVNVMKSLHEKKHMFHSELGHKELEERTPPAGEAVTQTGNVDVSTNSYSVASGMTESTVDHPLLSKSGTTTSSGHSSCRRLKEKDPAAHSAPSSPTNTNYHGMQQSDSTQQSLSESSRHNASSLTSINNAIDTPVVTDDIPRGSGTFPASVASNSEGGASVAKQKCAVCNSQKPEGRLLACGHFVCKECTKACTENQQHPCCEAGSWVVVDKDGENLLFVNGVARTTATADAATDSDKGKSDADRLKQEEASSKRGRIRALKKDDCVICLEQMTDPKPLDCGHKFCAACIDEYFEKGQPKCPSCGQLFGMLKGNQPPGKFVFKCIPQLRLSGYEHHGALEITYDIPNGIQTVVICYLFILM